MKLTLAAGLNLWAFLPYFWLQRHVFFPVTVIQPILLDQWISFNPAAVGIYLSLFLLTPVAPMQMTHRNQIWRYAAGLASMSLVADFFFLFWPTTVQRPPTPDTNEIYRLLVMFVLPFNALPSLHAAMAVFSALCFEPIAANVRRAEVWRTTLWIWAVAILYATVATKEHLAIDIAAGCFLGLTTYFCAFAALRSSGREVSARIALDAVQRRKSLSRGYK